MELVFLQLFECLLGFNGPLEVPQLLEYFEKWETLLHRFGYEAIKGHHILSEVMYLFDGVQLGHFLDHLNLLQICLVASMQPHEAQKHVKCYSKDTFHWVQLHLISA